MIQEYIVSLYYGISSDTPDRVMKIMATSERNAWQEAQAIQIFQNKPNPWKIEARRNIDQPSLIKEPNRTYVKH